MKQYLYNQTNIENMRELVNKFPIASLVKKQEKTTKRNKLKIKKKNS